MAAPPQAAIYAPQSSPALQPRRHTARNLGLGCVGVVVLLAVIAFVGQTAGPAGLSEAKVSCDEAITATDTWRHSTDKVAAQSTWYQALLDAFSKASDAQQKNSAFGPFAHDMLAFTGDAKALDSTAITSSYGQVLNDCGSIRDGKPPA